MVTRLARRLATCGKAGEATCGILLGHDVMSQILCRELQPTGSEVPREERAGQRGVAAVRRRQESEVLDGRPRTARCRSPSSEPLKMSLMSWLPKRLLMIPLRRRRCRRRARTWRWCRSSCSGENGPAAGLGADDRVADVVAVAVVGRCCRGRRPCPRRSAYEAGDTPLRWAIHWRGGEADHDLDVRVVDRGVSRGRDTTVLQVVAVVLLRATLGEESVAFSGGEIASVASLMPRVLFHDLKVPEPELDAAREGSPHRRWSDDRW